MKVMEKKVPCSGPVFSDADEVLSKKKKKKFRLVELFWVPKEEILTKLLGVPSFSREVLCHRFLKPINFFKKNIEIEHNF